MDHGVSELYTDSTPVSGNASKTNFSDKACVEVERIGEECNGYIVRLRYGEINMEKHVRSSQDVAGEIGRSAALYRESLGWPKDLPYLLEVHLYAGDKRDSEMEKNLAGFLKQKLEGIVSFAD